VPDPTSPPPPAQPPKPISPPGAQPAAQRPPEPTPPSGQAPDATAPIGAPPPGAGGPRWGEQGFQAPPDPGRQSRKAVAWIAGVVGVLGLIAVAVIGFSLLVATGDKQEQAGVGGTPLPSQPGQGDGQGSGQGSDQAPGQGPGAGGGSPSTAPAQGGRVTTPNYSIKLPDGFQDQTDAYRSQHPTEGGVVQSLTQANAAVQPAPEVRISRLPKGFGSGQSLDSIARTRAGALVQTPDGLSALQHSTLGPDPSVEVGLSLQSGGHRLEVLVRHGGRVWEISVIDPGKGQTTAAQAWQQTIKPGWQWPS
jgi:hypothetical protein